MAWGSWSASAITDWTRSPRRQQKLKAKECIFDTKHQNSTYRNFFRSFDNTDAIEDDFYTIAKSDVVDESAKKLLQTALIHGNNIVDGDRDGDVSDHYQDTKNGNFVTETTKLRNLSRRSSLNSELNNLQEAFSGLLNDDKYSIKSCSHHRIPSLCNQQQQQQLQYQSDSESSSLGNQSFVNRPHHHHHHHSYNHHPHNHHHHHHHITPIRRKSQHGSNCYSSGASKGSVSAGNTLNRNDFRRKTITTSSISSFSEISDVEYSMPLKRQIIHFKPDRIEYFHEHLLFGNEIEETPYATVFPNVPPNPGMLCQGEDKSIYRRGARRWRKLYRINGHIFQAKRFNRRAFCAFCHDRIWGLGRQGFKCNQCKLLVHKKCHKFVKNVCAMDRVETINRDDTNGDMSVHQHQFVANNHSLTSSETKELTVAEQQNQNAAIATTTAVTALDSIPVEGDLLSLEPGSQRQYSLNDFELIRVIGRGSFAKVLMVELKKTQRIYAMKVIKKALITEDEDIDWVQSEKHVFETASNHPFLVGLHSCFQTASRLFFVIEFVRGGDLMFHMQRQRRLPEEHARFYAAEISIALNFLHEKGIIYRDLKLDNVLLDHEGHIKLTDYGMCKEGIRPGDTTSTFCGTPNYIAPEILRGEDYSFSVDWWALGVLLYEMLAGRSPFDVEKVDSSDQQTEDYLFQVILNKVIRIPRTLSVKASSVLKSFLNKDPTVRLGCSESGFRDVVDHPFFRSIDWEQLEQKQVTPPYTPRLDSDRDLANFPPEFTDELVQLTPDEPSELEKIDQTEFEGFEYVNPLLMSLEDCV